MSNMTGSGTSAGDDVMKAVGDLDSATANLNTNTEQGCADEDEAVGILTVIGRVILGLFGK